MSFTLLVLNLGFVSNFLVLWLRSLSVAFVVALVISALVFPLVTAILSRLVTVRSDPVNLGEAIRTE